MNGSTGERSITLVGVRHVFLFPSTFFNIFFFERIISDALEEYYVNVNIGDRTINRLAEEGQRLEDLVESLVSKKLYKV